MSGAWIDVSIPLAEDTVVWPGDTAFCARPASRIASGDGCNTTILALETHTGTHFDAPWHFEEDGARTDAVDASLFFGDALVVDIPLVVRSIRVVDLPATRLPSRVLFRTSNSKLPVKGAFHEDFVALEPCAARRLAADGVRLVGIDYLSIAPFRQPEGETHHILLGNGVLAIEGLRLAGILPGIHPFMVLPLPLTGLDGAPCRAFVYQERVAS